MRWPKLIQRQRLAWQLLREHEAAQEPLSWEEVQARLARFQEAVESGNWKVDERRSGATKWREAVEAAKGNSTRSI